MYFEENYNDLDGRMSTQNKLTPKDDTLPQPKQPEQPNPPDLIDSPKDFVQAPIKDSEKKKESIRAKLKHVNENIVFSDQKVTAPIQKHQLNL